MSNPATDTDQVSGLVADLHQQAARQRSRKAPVDTLNLERFRDDPAFPFAVPPPPCPPRHANDDSDDRHRRALQVGNCREQHQDADADCERDAAADSQDLARLDAGSAPASPRP